MQQCIDVHLIRVFEGPRHETLYKLWDTVAEFYAEEIRVIWFANPECRLEHADCLNRIWVESQDRDSTRMIITEADFLPNLSNTDRWLQAPLDDKRSIAFAGAMYANREAGTRAVRHFSGLPAAWFLSFAKERCPKILDFRGPPDPATRLPDQFEDGQGARLYKGLDEYPRFLSLTYPFGTHLFWSRHLNDDPTLRVSGFSCHEIQTKHDRRVRKWLLDQPKAFRKLVEDRHGSILLG